MKKFKLQDLIFLLIFYLFITPVSIASSSQQTTAINNLLKTSASLPMQQRIERISNYFINVPYQLEPLGEGRAGQFNQEPLYRFDKFDCQTYVSTVLALANSCNFDSFTRNIQLIDYENGKISFTTRNHFTDGDWVPNNIKQGFIKDINYQVAGKKVMYATTLIDKENWIKNLTAERIHIDNLTTPEINIKLLQLHQLSHSVKNKWYSLPYIPASALFIGQQKIPGDIFNDIPSGAIILIVHPVTNINNNTINGNTTVVHMGLTVRYNHQLYIREASSYFGRVIDVPLINYLLFVNPMSDKQGISLFMPVSYVR